MTGLAWARHVLGGCDPDTCPGFHEQDPAEAPTLAQAFQAAAAGRPLLPAPVGAPLVVRSEEEAQQVLSAQRAAAGPQAGTAGVLIVSDALDVDRAAIQAELDRAFDVRPAQLGPRLRLRIRKLRRHLPPGQPAWRWSVQPTSARDDVVVQGTAHTWSEALAIGTAHLEEHRP